ncbi:Recombination protein RecR [Planctomycetes bacterium Pan216]|uniref:Recombination protein RecR n=1 Tax=Kolteria novifilia TaxID=2527975 RepID=A0A518B9D2_9BACT|nr:Recombination protein RecR [Planctomycetes bacterium Pan216]
MSLTPSVERLTEELTRLPGIGPKSAERITHYLMQARAEDALKLARAIEDVKTNVRLCRECFNLSEGTDICQVCQDARRDQSLLCVVEQPRDLMSLEKTGSFQGVYHVLHGRIAPLEGITPDKLTIGPLVDRVRRGTIKEVIMATNPTLEGDGTALYLSNVLADYDVNVTRLARGLASGTVLEFANREMLADALSGRQKF